MREIFAEEARDRNYEENKADIISELSSNMDRNHVDHVTKMEQVLQLLKEIQGGNEQMKRPNMNEKMYSEKDISVIQSFHRLQF